MKKQKPFIWAPRGLKELLHLLEGRKVILTDIDVALKLLFKGSPSVLIKNINTWVPLLENVVHLS